MNRRSYIVVRPAATALYIKMGCCGRNKSEDGMEMNENGKDAGGGKYGNGFGIYFV